MRILQLLDNGGWMQLGQDIVGDNDETGENLELNRDGNFLVLGSGGAINSQGIVKVYLFQTQKLIH